MAARIRETSGDDLEESHDINVTPFIDVILVLLIIFMVAAPLATVDVNVDLPGSTATPAPRPETPLFLTLRSDLTLAIGNDSVPRLAFAAVLDRRTKGDKLTRIFLRADKTVGYGDLMEVMNLLRGAGYLKVALVGLETAGGVGGQATPGTPATGANPVSASGGSPAP
ncbi:TonB system transport protein ExbD [Mesorhizobium sp. WSM4976]|uniref:TonB system transport protein ExbD n=1 Tax=Mesorhizobium sp. WSM4976 TaxID=3038549 RepID=UPI002417369B|nr:TonB system transport protein ExbD [Mesorhizobium sp. WSM4976]MDG4893095.1 TonB system transport protein ExbD [Mesorhizobium sp. WSM4976]